MQQLTYFLAAAEHGSFSAAAESLHMAQPSLSEQIRRLEAELGVPLFARAGRGARADRGRPAAAARTPSARSPRPQAAPSRCARCATLTGGTVAFGTFGSAHHYLLGGLVEEFRAPLPGVRVRVVGQNSAEVADAVRDGAARGRPGRAPGRRPRARRARRRCSEELLYVSAEPRARRASR